MPRSSILRKSMSAKLSSSILSASLRLAFAIAGACIACICFLTGSLAQDGTPFDFGKRGKRLASRSTPNCGSSSDGRDGISAVSKVTASRDACKSSDGADGSLISSKRTVSPNASPSGGTRRLSIYCFSSASVAGSRFLIRVLRNFGNIYISPFPKSIAFSAPFDNRKSRLR